MKKVIIKYNDYNEYEVPTPTPDCPDSIYYTDDLDDAKDTARRNAKGQNLAFTLRRGTYTTDGYSTPE